jgi:hypothetical protein
MPTFAARGLLAAILVALAATAPSALAAPVLDGRPRVEEVKLMRPSAGVDRGRLLAWVRVSHAPLTADGGRRAGAASGHLGEVTVRLRGARREARAVLPEHADGKRREQGYLVRFPDPRPAVRAAAAGIRVRVAVTQSVDLDGDADDEASAADTTTQTVVPSVIAQTVVPLDGLFEAHEGIAPGSSFSVLNGQITMAEGVSTDGSCINVATGLSVPIDPSGAFAVEVPGQPVALLSGQFEPGEDGSSALAVAQVSILSGAPPSTGCRWTAPDPSTFNHGLQPLRYG